MPDRRRALALLAACRDGCTEAMMLAHGVTIGQVVELVNAGLASAPGAPVLSATVSALERGTNDDPGPLYLLEQERELKRKTQATQQASDSGRCSGPQAS
jgi:hypothetical protein